MKLNNDMDLVRSLGKILFLARSHGHDLPAVIDDAHDRIEGIASDAMSYTLRRMVEEAKASTDETIAMLRRR